MSGVLVLVEHRQGAAREVTFEMLAAGRRLAAAMETDCAAVLFGGGPELAAEVATRADRVIHARHDRLDDFNYEAHQRALAALVRERQAAVVLVAHTAFGSDLGPSLAVTLGCGVVSDAVAFAKSAAGLVVTRGQYAGKLCAELLVPALPVVLMARQSSFKPDEPGAAGGVEAWDASAALAAPLATRFITLEELPVTGIDITRAEVVVGIGRGVKDAANVALVQEFADAIGGVLAGSRPVIDAGWLEKERQVGSSGRTVKPKLYIALGISGSFQHVAGMRGAETIIAVNKDPHAPIFSVAHYGVVDDLLKVVPALRAKLAEMKS